VKQRFPEGISNLSPESSIRNLPPDRVLEVKALVMTDCEGSDDCAVALLQKNRIDEFTSGIAANAPKKIGGEKHGGPPYSRRQS